MVIVGDYFKGLLDEFGFDYEIDRNNIIIDCAGNDLDFIRLIGFINKNIEAWTYELELAVNIRIDTSFEKVVIEYFGDF